MPKEITEFEQARKKRRRKLASERMTRFLMAVFLVGIVVLGVYKAVESDVAGVVGDMAAAAGGGMGLPVEIAGNTVRSTFECSGNIGLLTDTAIYLYGSSGKQLLYEQHGMADPAAEAAGRRMLVFDRGGEKLLVRTRDRVLFEKEFDYGIIDATLSKNGYLTVVTGAQRYAAEVRIWEPEYKEIVFSWSSADSYVLTARMAPDNKTVAAVSIGAENGEINSTVHFFASDAPQELAKRTFSGTAVLDTAFSGSGDLKLIGDNMAATVAKDGTILGEYDYDGTLLAYCNLQNRGPTALVFDDYKERRSSRVVILGDDCVISGQASVPGRATGAAASANRVAVFTPGRADVFDMKGGLIGTSDGEAEILKMLISGNSIYAVSRGELFVPRI